ncbi:PREDICTED: uncharacterized protein LOC101295532 [Fragaria vesca subsp. vesca]|uniref:uncharacterized protein LOC101295532 n=1 Tax=Fragaria vesca subsp. vesca TaxID=101020 RepID=UPI0002C342FD|nr:PREDICTED: uncharacterized protein LOC101295532 [Fragaria vesca subsp. vesca]
MVSLFNYCAYASTKEQFAKELSRFKKVGGKIAIKFLASLPDENWSNAYFPGKRYGEMCSNIAESFNSWVKEERELLIYELVDGIRLKVMKMNSERRLDVDTWNGFLCLVIKKQVDVSVEAGRHWEVVRSSYMCLKCGITILKNEDNPYDYTEDYFSVSDFKESYSHPVLPIPDIERVVDSDNDHGLKPPLTKIPPGRPKRKRIPSNGENPRPIKCGRCGSSGRHNRKSCTAKI